jgi:pyruvate dehydrogenase E2 component (dihydrolipoamide acetyltransferase)
MFEFRLPDVGEGVSEGELLTWHVAPGDEVVEDQLVAEVETDKAVVDLPTPVAGTVETLHAAEGEVVPVGDVIITIVPADPTESNVDEAAVEREVEAAIDAGDDEFDGADAAVSEASSGTGRVFAPPSVRRLARERDVDIGAVDGSGPGGRVTEADVEAAATSGAGDDDVADAITEVAPEANVGDSDEGEEGSASPTSAIRRVDDDDSVEVSASESPRERTLATPATRRLADDLGVDLDAVPTDESRDGEAFVTESAVAAYAEAQTDAQAADAATLGESDVAGEASRQGEAVAGERETREPYRGVRRTIGEQMAESAFSIPHVTHHDVAVVPELVATRAAMNERLADRDLTLTYVPFVLNAVVAGLREYPVLNSSLDEDAGEVVYKHYYDIGVATATDAGLMVPVVEAVDEKGLIELAEEVRELTAKARDRSIEREEMQGGTFTITNFGPIGGEYATPLINHPETAILGLGAIEQRPTVVDGDVVAEYTLPLSLSIDHRVIDGAEAANFANTVIDYLEHPGLSLLDE